MGRELSSSRVSLNRAQRYWLAAVVPVLVAIPFWWRTHYIETEQTTTIYLAVVATLATAWIVLSLLRLTPWRRIPRQTMTVLMPVAAFALTVFAILIDHSWWLNKVTSLLVGFTIQTSAVCGFWIWRKIGKPPPSKQCISATYWIVAGATFLALLWENRMWWEVFGPTNLPYWFASLTLLTLVMLRLLRGSDYEDVAFVMTSSRATSDAGIPISGVDQDRLNDHRRPGSR